MLGFLLGLVCAVTPDRFIEDTHLVFRSGTEVAEVFTATRLEAGKNPGEWRVSVEEREIVTREETVRDQRGGERVFVLGDAGQLMAVQPAPDREALYLARLTRFVEPPAPLQPEQRWRIRYEDGFELEFTCHRVDGQGGAHIGVQLLLNGQPAGEGIWRIPSDPAIATELDARVVLPGPWEEVRVTLRRRPATS